MNFKPLLSLLAFLFSLFLSIKAISQTKSDIRVLLKDLGNANTDSEKVRLNLLVAKYHIFKTGENKADLDTAFRYIKIAENISKKLHDKKASGHLALIASYWYRERGKKEEGRKYIDTAIRLLPDASDPGLLGEAYDELAQYYDYRTDMEAKVAAITKAAAAHKSAGNNEAEGASRQLLGDIYSLHGKSEDSNRELDRALTLYNKIGKPDLQGIYSIMARNYNRVEDYHKAYKYGILGVKAAERVGDTTRQLYGVYDPVTQASYRLHDTAQAIYYFDKLLGVANKYRDTVQLVIIQLQYANVLFAFNRDRASREKLLNVERHFGHILPPFLKFRKDLYLMLVYAKLGQNKLARQYRDAIGVGYEAKAALPFQPMETSLLTYLVEYHLKLNELRLAGDYLQLLHQRADSTQNLRHLGTAYFCQFRLDTASHNFESAVKSMLKYRYYDDSLKVEEAGKQANFLKIEYESSIKDQNIQILTDKNQLQKADLEYSNLVRNLSFLGLFLMLVILVLLFNQFRIKQRANREILDKNDYQQRLLLEKDWLVKEIHHRVKNNLQTIMSLLESQSSNLKNDALVAIKDSQHRVHAMSLIHQKLYLTENVTMINMQAYIEELVTYLQDSFNTCNRIFFRLDLEAIDLDVSQAIPIGLILNEAITNSIKYAFPESRQGEIGIVLSQVAFRKYELVIADNGIGFPDGLNKSEVTSLGMSLLRGLTHEIGGELTMQNRGGAFIGVVFTEDSILRPSRADVVPNI